MKIPHTNILCGFMWTLLPVFLFLALGWDPLKGAGKDLSDEKFCEPSELRFWNSSKDRPVSQKEIKSVIVLSTNTNIYRTICRPTKLTMLVSGTPAGGKSAQLVFNINMNNIAIIDATKERPLEIIINRPGLLTISFMNDLYTPNSNPPQDRGIFIRNLSFH